MKIRNKSTLFVVLLSISLAILIFIGFQLLFANKVRQPLQGSFTLLGDPTSNDLSSSCFDLDNGEPTDTSKSDICFGASIGSTVFYVLSPVNNASAKIMSLTQPNLEGCKSELDKFSQGNIPELEVNNYICILTNQQQYALLNIKASRRVSATGIELTIEFITWENSISQ